MKKTIRTLSVFLVVAVLSVCGCLFGCSSKQNPDPVDPSPIVVETVDIKEFFDKKEDVFTSNSVGLVFEMKIGIASEDENQEIYVAIALNTEGDISSLDFTGIDMIYGDTSDESTMVYVKDEYMYLTDENGQKIKTANDGSLGDIGDVGAEVIIIAFMWDFIVDMLFAGLEYTGIQIQKETNFETGDVKYILDVATSLMGNIEISRAEVVYNGNDFVSFYMGSAEGFGMHVSTLEQLPFPADLDEVYEAI